MGEMDSGIFSMTGSENNRMLRGLGRLRCPPAVVITHDHDSFSSLGVNPSGDAMVGYKCSGSLGPSSFSTDRRNGVYGMSGPPSRSGSPRHIGQVHPSDGNCLPKSSSSTSESPHSQSGGMMTRRGLRVDQKATKRRCVSSRARRWVVGIFLTAFVCTTCIGVTHLLKWSYVIHLHPFGFLNGTLNMFSISRPNFTSITVPPDVQHSLESSTASDANTNVTQESVTNTTLRPFKAPFFTTWVYTACNCVFFPVYLCTTICSRRKRTAKKAFFGAIHRFQEKGLSALHIITRSMFFCVLWIAANFMLIHSLTILDATALMALQASSVAFIYLLSWVILHEQFVGIRIVAVILCNTGIALLAYMDGVSKTSTLGAVVLAAAAAAGLAVHKVLFKKLIGDVSMGQLSLFLTLVGFMSILLLWPIGLTIYLVEAEVLIWAELPYIQIAGAGAFFTIGNIMVNFDIMHSYDTFLKLGTVSAIPLSAVLDVYLYNVVFQGMKLAGVLVISIGFLLVLLPDNWPDYITQILRWRWRKGKPPQVIKVPDAPAPHPQVRSRIRTTSGTLK